jgi:hypothetical protein
MKRWCVAVFSAVRYNPIAAREQLPFDEILVDTASGFDTTRTVYTVSLSAPRLLYAQRA